MRAVDFFYSGIRSAARRFFISIFRFFPINAGSVVFDNFNGGGFGCNPKYIAEALEADCLKLVWLARDLDSGDFPSYIKVVRYDSLRAWYYLETARVIVSNVRNSKGVIKRQGQKYVQTWHASLGPKMVEKDAEKSLSRSYVKQAKKNGEETDLMFANNELMASVYRASFWYSGKLIRCGVPRNRDLIRCDTDVRRRVRAKLNLPENDFVCLYAPTWRDTEGEVPFFDFAKCRIALEKRFGSESVEVVLCVRFHPNTDRSQYDISAESVVDLSDYPDTQELLSAIDLLISDYSSIIEDFTFTSNPAFMYVPDYDRYIAHRQFYYPLDKRPYPICRTEEDLYREIEVHSDEVLSDRLNLFREEFGIMDDGLGANTLADIVRGWTHSDTKLSSKLE